MSEGGGWAQAKSSYLESFLKLAEHIEAKTEEARSALHPHTCPANPTDAIPQPQSHHRQSLVEDPRTAA